MEITTAKNAGACYGVTRSLEIVKKTAEEGKKTATLGELIHNPNVVLNLEKNYGVTSVDSVAEAIDNNIENIIVRSHGVPLETLEEAKNSGISIIDATCPYVKNVQNTASLLAGLYPAVIIIGKKDHPEIKSVSSFIANQGTKCFVGETESEIDEFIDEILSLNDSVGVVSQTTQSAEVFENMLNYIKSKGVKTEVENTICAATKKRQQSALELSKEVDAMIVIGGYNSSNTNHLADLCRENCKHVYHIENIDELNISEIYQFNRVGITAGASTPISQIEQIFDYLS